MATLEGLVGQPSIGYRSTGAFCIIKDSLTKTRCFRVADIDGGLGLENLIFVMLPDHGDDFPDNVGTVINQC